jgi:hypothetical protein
VAKLGNGVGINAGNFNQKYTYSWSGCFPGGEEV